MPLPSSRAPVTMAFAADEQAVLTVAV